MAFPANPVFNPNFEYDTLGKAPLGWSVAATSEVTSPSAVVAGSFTLGTGVHALSVTGTHAANTTAKEMWATFTKAASVPATVGSKYTLQLSVNAVVAAPEGFIVRSVWTESDKTTVVSTTSSAALLTGLSGEHILETESAVAPAKAAYLNVEIAVASKVSGYLWNFVIDKVIIGEGGSVPIYVDGDYDGYEWTGTPGNSATNVYTITNHPGALLPSGPQLSTKYTLTGPDGTVATFNDPADPNFVGSITEATGLDSPEVRENAENITGMDGGIHGNFYHGRRPITLSGSIYNVKSNEERNIKITKLTQASNAMREDATLEWTPDGGERQFVKLRRQQALRITGGWAKNFQVLFVAADPRIYGTGLTEKVLPKVIQELFPAGVKPKGMATDGTHVYWTTSEGAFIGRATVGGGSVEPKWTTIGEFANGVAVDAGHVYWVSPTGIGRCTIAGATVENKWIATTISGVGVAVDAGHVYWGESGGIGRATIAGATIEKSWIFAVTSGQGVCVDATHIYWADRKNNRIARATISGTLVENEWITNAGNEPAYPAVTGTNIYWCDYAGNQIRRANINGTEVVEDFVSSPEAGPYGTAVAGSTLFITNFNEGTVSAVPLEAYTTVTNYGSTLSYPLIQLSGKPRNFEIVNLLTGQKVVLNYNYALPVTIVGGLPTGITYAGNDGATYWFTYNSTIFGKIGISGAELNRSWNSLSPTTPTGITANGSKVYISFITGSGNYAINSTPKSFFSDEAVYTAALPEEVFALGANETTLFWGDRTSLNSATVAGTGKATIVAGANVLKGSEILVTATKLWWCGTGGEVKESLLTGSTVKTILTGTKATSIAVDASHIYWTNTSTGTIGRSTLAGTEVEPEWMKGQAEPRGIVVSATAATWINSVSGALVSVSLSEPTLSATIDLLNRTVTLSTGQSIYSAVNFGTTKWFGILPGPNKLQVIQQNASEAISATVVARNAWI